MYRNHLHCETVQSGEKSQTQGCRSSPVDTRPEVLFVLTVQGTVGCTGPVISSLGVTAECIP